MRLKESLLLFFLVVYQFGYAQQNDLFEKLNKNVERFVEDSSASAESKIDTLQYFLIQAKLNQNSISIIYSYQNLATLYYQLGKVNEALRYYKLYVLEVQRLTDLSDFDRREFEISLYRNEINALNEKIIMLEKEVEDLESTKKEYFESNYIIYLGLRIVAGIAIILIIGWLYLRYKNSKLNKESTEKAAQEKDDKLSELLVNTRQQLTELQTEMDLSGILVQHNILKPESFFDVNKSIRRKFLINLPKALSGGDGFYIQSVKQQTVIAVFDAPGYGVSGGLLSSQITSQINDLVVKHNIFSPASLVKQLESNIRSLFPAGIPFIGGVKIGVCLYNSAEKTLSYAGAKITLYAIHKGIMNRYRGEQLVVLDNDNQIDLSNTTMDVLKGMNFYLSTNGFWDQVGGHEYKPLGVDAFEKALESMYPQPVKDHGAILTKIFSDWKGANEQIDDVIVFGFGF